MLNRMSLVVPSFTLSQGAQHMGRVLVTGLTSRSCSGTQPGTSTQETGTQTKPPATHIWSPPRKTSQYARTRHGNTHNISQMRREGLGLSLNGVPGLMGWGSGGDPSQKLKPSVAFRDLTLALRGDSAYFQKDEVI